MVGAFTVFNVRGCICVKEAPFSALLFEFTLQNQVSFGTMECSGTAALPQQLDLSAISSSSDKLGSGSRCCKGGMSLPAAALTSAASHVFSLNSSSFASSCIAALVHGAPGCGNASYRTLCLRLPSHFIRQEHSSRKRCTGFGRGLQTNRLFFICIRHSGNAFLSNFAFILHSGHSLLCPSHPGRV